MCSAVLLLLFYSVKLLLPSRKRGGSSYRSRLRQCRVASSAECTRLGSGDSRPSHGMLTSPPTHQSAGHFVARRGLSGSIQTGPKHTSPSSWRVLSARGWTERGSVRISPWQTDRFRGITGRLNPRSRGCPRSVSSTSRRWRIILSPAARAGWNYL